MTNHTLKHLTPHIHWFSPSSTTDRPVLGVITGSHDTLLVDAGNSPAHAELLLAAMTDANLPGPTYLALTHWHWDHVFGTAALALPTFAHTLTGQVVREMAEQDWGDAALDQRVAAGSEITFCRDMIKAELPDRSNLHLRPPEITFTERVELDLGGVVCHLIHVGGDHAADSSIIYVPEDRVVFLGDCIYPDIYHSARRYTTAEIFPLLDCLLSLNADLYIAGHHPAPMSRHDLETEATLLRTIGQLVTIHAGDRAAILQALPAYSAEPVTEDHHELIDNFIVGLPTAV